LETFQYSHSGFCPICKSDVVFSSTNPWFRDFLVCPKCPGGSVPRERALFRVLEAIFPAWEASRIHESSPAERGVSLKLRERCSGYTGTHYFPTDPVGTLVRGFRNENIENQTFPDEEFDIVVTLDVMEHVNRPDLAFREIARTLKQEGYCISSIPTYKGQNNTERKAVVFADCVEHLAPPEYHGNPVAEEGSLVTFHYGYDLPELIHAWSGMSVTVLRFHSHEYGIIGEFTEIYVCQKSSIKQGVAILNKME
jgi:SAM-dependent methyltransferase